MRLDLMPAGTELDGRAVPYPFVAVPGDAALAALQRLAASQPGSSPVILGDRSEAARLFEHWDDRTGAEAANAVVDALSAAAAGSGVDLLDAYRSGVEAALAASYRSRGRGYAGLEDETPPIDADGPLPAPHMAPIGLVDHRTGRLKPEVLVGLLPTSNAFEAPAYLGFGGWRGCPPAPVHVALGRDWQARYGARLILNTPDVIEYEIERPIETRDEALALAWVHYRYCADTVSELVGSIEGLAAILRGGRYWYFWWQ